MADSSFFYFSGKCCKANKMQFIFLQIQTVYLKTFQLPKTKTMASCNNIRVYIDFFS